MIIDEPEVDGFCVVQFTQISYKLQYSIEVNGDTITEVKLVCDTKNIGPDQEW